MLQGEHSAILLTFIKQPFVIKTIFLSIFEWAYKTGFAVTENPILAESSCTHMHICEHLGTSLIKVSNGSDLGSIFLFANIVKR